MKTMWLLGLLPMLMVAYNLVAGSPREASQAPGRPVAKRAPVLVKGGARLPAGLTEYMFLHQTRDENLPVHAMAGVTTCPE